MINIFIFICALSYTIAYGMIIHNIIKDEDLSDPWVSLPKFICILIAYIFLLVGSPFFMPIVGVSYGLWFLYTKYVKDIK